MVTSGKPGLRADAQRNRDRIIAGAREVFTIHGPDAPMESIAAHVGVGVGTLYRRFPDRDSLLTAVAAEMFTSASAAATSAAGRESDEWAAVVRTVRACASPHIGALSAALRPWLAAHRTSSPILRELSAQWESRFDALVKAAQGAGRMRDDVTTTDALQLISLVTCHLPDLSSKENLAASLRYLDVILDGLHTPIAAPVGDQGE